MADQLEEMFVEQDRIQRDLFALHFERMSDPAKIVFIKEMVLSITAELHEALNETGWKSWSTSRHIHTDRYLSELVDVQLMLINLFLVTGIKPADLAYNVADLVAIKQKINVERQESGYSA